jgi:hypothetical protein
MFRISSCPSSGAYKLQQQPLVYRWNVVIAVLLVVVGPAGPTTTNSTTSATSPTSNIRLRTVYKEIYTFGLPKKHSGRKKIIIHNFFQQQVQTFKYLSGEI